MGNGDPSIAVHPRTDSDTQPDPGPASRRAGSPDRCQGGPRMTVTQSAPSTETPTAISLAPEDSAADLLNAMAAMPAGHPSRTVLGDRAIEAWLPLARHLAH